MNRGDAFITLTVKMDGSYALSITDREGYNRIIDKELTYEAAYRIAQAVDNIAEVADVARNQVADGKLRRKARIRALKAEIESKQEQLERLES